MFSTEFPTWTLNVLCPGKLLSTTVFVIHDQIMLSIFIFTVQILALKTQVVEHEKLTTAHSWPKGEAYNFGLQIMTFFVFETSKQESTQTEKRKRKRKQRTQANHTNKQYQWLYLRLMGSLMIMTMNNGLARSNADFYHLFADEFFRSSRDAFYVFVE